MVQWLMREHVDEHPSPRNLWGKEVHLPKMDHRRTPILAIDSVLRSERDGESQEQLAFCPGCRRKLPSGHVGLSEVEDPIQPAVAESGDRSTPTCARGTGHPHPRAGFHRPTRARMSSWYRAIASRVVSFTSTNVSSVQTGCWATRSLSLRKTKWRSQ